MYDMSVVTGAWKSQSSLDADLAVLGHQIPDDDANLTPIFHSLARGALRRPPNHAPHASVPPPAPPPRVADPVAEFEQDPLHAPIPPQTMAAPTTPVRALRSVSGGRHRR